MYLLRRISYMFMVLIGVSMIMFVVVRVMPGDPIAKALGPMADEEAIQKMRRDMGLDRPIPIQYLNYLRGISRGQLGLSLVENRDTADIIIEKLPATLELILSAMTLAVTLAIPLGVISALRRNSIIDHAARIVALFGVSFPQFWVGLMFQLLFGYLFALLPITGRISGAAPSHITGMYLLDSILTLNWSTFWGSFVHLISPALIMSLAPLANITRLIRASMIDEMGKDYINVSKATGMSGVVISYKYMLRNAFSSTLTMIGFLIPLMLGTGFVVEKVFAWPGIARFGADAIIAQDFNGVVGVTLVICMAFVVINFFVDELYSVLDPRIKLKR